MRPRTTAILFVVATLLGAFVYLYEIKGSATREEAVAESSRIFPEVTAEAIDTLEFRTQDDRQFKGVRAGDGWEIRTPITFPGDDVNLDAIASTLANLKSENTIEAPGAPEIYGLGASAKPIEFRVGEQDFALEIGADTPVGGNVYVARRGDAGSVWSVASFRVGSFARDLDSLRDRRVLSFDRTRVSRVVAGWPGASVTLEKFESDWVITKPQALSGPADARAVDDLLSDVAFLRAVGFVDSDPGEGKALDSEEGDSESSVPYYTLRIGLDTDADSQTPAASLEVGLEVLENPDLENYLVRTEQPDVLYSVPRSRIDGFPRGLFAFRYKELSTFDTADVKSFELVFHGDGDSTSSDPVSVRVDRVATGWQAAGEEWIAGAAAGLIAEFARLEAISVVAESADEDALAALGLLPARAILRAYAAPTANDADPPEGSAQDADPDQDDVGAREMPRKLLAEVSLGAFDPVAGIVAKARGQAPIYRLDAALAEQIPISLDAFRSRFLAPPAEALPAD